MAEGGSDDIQSLACIKDLGFEETEMMTTRAEGKFIVQHHHYHRNLYLGSVYYGDGDIVQGSKTQVKDSQIEALIASSGEPDPPRQQHPDRLSGCITQAALEWIEEGKIPTEGIENADDTSAGNQTRLKQILGIPNPGTSDTAPGTRRTTKPAISHSSTQTIPEFFLDIDLILLEEFKELALEDADYKTALEMINLYDNEDVEQDNRDFLPLFTTIWSAIQLKIVMRSFERHLASGCKISRLVEKILIKLISKYNKANEEEQSLNAFIPRVNEVIKLGEQYRSNKNFIHAVVSFYAAGKLLKLKHYGNISVLGITDCVGQILQVGSAMIDQTVLKQIVIDHVIPLMHETTNMLRSIQGSTHSIRVEHEVWCLYYIGNSYYDCNKYKLSSSIIEPAIDLMKRQLGDEAEKYKLYGICHSFAADAYYCMGDYTKTIEKYKMWLKVAEKANDWENDVEKNNFIAEVKEDLQLAEAKLKQSLKT